MSEGLLFVLQVLVLSVIAGFGGRLGWGIAAVIDDLVPLLVVKLWRACKCTLAAIREGVLGVKS